MPVITRSDSMGSALVVLAILIWSSLGVVIRLSGASVLNIIFYSSVISSVVLLPIISLKRHRRNVPRNVRSIGVLLLIGPLILVNNFTFFTAYQYTSITNAILTHYVAPVLVAVLAFFFLGERLTRYTGSAIVIATGGLWILLGVNPIEFVQEFLIHRSTDSLGIISGLASGLAYAFIIITMRIISQSHDPVVMCFFQNIAISAILLPFITVSPWPSIWSYLVVGILHSTIAPIIYFLGIERTEANRAAILGYAEPVGAIIFGMIFLSEYPEARSLLGGALIVFSGYLTLTDERRRKNNAGPKA